MTVVLYSYLEKLDRSAIVNMAMIERSYDSYTMRVKNVATYSEFIYKLLGAIL